MWVPDRTWQTTIAVVAMMVNYYLLSWVWDATVDKDDQGRLQPVEAVGTEFYLLSGLLLASCLGMAVLIRYPSSDVRWGARILFCLLPALAGLYFLAKELGLVG
ncbi:MAG: hypothetical protein AAF495_18035 [Pseudomonadota bacterium]